MLARVADPVDQGQDLAVQEWLGDEALDQAGLHGLLHHRVVREEIPGDQDDERVDLDPAQVLDELRAFDIRELGIDENAAVAVLAAKGRFTNNLPTLPSAPSAWKRIGT